MSDSLHIPPVPEVLLSIQKLMAEEEPDIQKIASQVKEDIALYTLFLSAANSPWMGLSQPATSIEHAIMLMGLNRIYTMLQAMMVRTSFQDSVLKESFWTTAIDVAGICSDLSNRFSGFDRNLAYSIGMLHNAGIAIMLKQFPEFENFIKTHEHLPSDKLCVYEKREFGTDHFLQGALMARQWHLGEDVALTIRCQPIADQILLGKKKMDDGISTYLAILSLAKGVSTEFRKYWLLDQDDNNSVANTMGIALDFMQISHGDFDELKEDLLEDFITKTAY